MLLVLTVERRRENPKGTTSCSPDHGKSTHQEKHRYPNCQNDSIGMVVPVDPDYCTRTCKKKHSGSIRAVPENI